jgi:hypothetical protein
MSEYKMYMVVIQPRAEYRQTYSISMKVVVARSQAEALRTHGMEHSEKKYYCKPFVKPFLTGKEYRL